MAPAALSQHYTIYIHHINVIIKLKLLRIDIMKKTLIILATMITLGAVQSQAQSLRDLFKKVNKNEQSSQSETSQKVQSALSGLGGVGDLVAGLLGSGNVNEDRIVGTWSYKQPAIVFESENMLTNVGGMAAGKAAEKKLQGYLDKIGFSAGKVNIDFKEDSTGVITYAKKDIPFQWSVEESDLTIKLGSGKLSKYTSSNKLGKYTTFKMNCNINLTTMQLAFKADKLMEFISKIASSAGKASNNSTISSIAGLADKVDGMYLGLTLEK